jgi:hypothetical protein
MKPAAHRTVLGKAQRALLAEALASPQLPDAANSPVSQPANAPGARLPDVVIENPSHDQERDTRRFRLQELQVVRQHRQALSEEFQQRDRSSPDYNKLPSQLREAEAREAVLTSALESQFLPQHSPDQLISPQLFFMSRMFNVRSRAAPRANLVEFALGRTTQGEVTYAGPEMRQGDGLVFMALLNLVRDVQVGKRTSFEPQDVCMALWGTYNGEARNRLRQCIFRLQHAVVRFPTFSVQLVLRFEYPKRGRWSVVMDEDIAHLFKESRLVWLDLEQRRTLPEGLATWLYAYVESQTTLIPWAVDKLRDLCGSDAQPREFSIVLSRALTKLASSGVIDSGWSLRNGTLHWRKPLLLSDQKTT